MVLIRDLLAEFLFSPLFLIAPSELGPFFPNADPCDSLIFCQKPCRYFQPFSSPSAPSPSSTFPPPSFLPPLPPLTLPLEKTVMSFLSLYFAGCFLRTPHISALNPQVRSLSSFFFGFYDNDGFARLFLARRGSGISRFGAFSDPSLLWVGFFFGVFFFVGFEIKGDFVTTCFYFARRLAVIVHMDPPLVPSAFESPPMLRSMVISFSPM